MKIYVKNHGCSANKAYSEMLRGIYTSVKEIKDSDIILINTCALKTPSEYKLSREITEIEKKYPDKKIRIIGCLPKAFPKHPKFKKYFLKFDFEKNKVKLNFPRVRENKLIGIIPVSEGCLNFCSFCAGKLAKGKLFSYPESKILKEIKNAIKDGCKEIYLTSQDMGCYGFDRNTNLVKLLKKIVSIEGDFLVRIGMMNPQYIVKFINELINIYKSKKIYKFLHIPVQSGSNNILKSMNRTYSVKDFEKIVQTFRKEIPNITISTDIIVGFPGETINDFQKTLDLVERIKPEVLNLTRYFYREGTLATNFPNQLHSRDKKERSRQLSELFEKIYFEKNKKWLQKEFIVLINGKGTKKNQYRGRTLSYTPIIVNSKKNILGYKIKVKIKKIGKSCLISEINQ